MKVWKLVSGIFSIIFTLVILLHSFLAGVVNTVLNTAFGSSETSGTAGIVIAVLLLIAGITSIAVRKRETKKAYTTLIVLFELAAMIGFVGSGNYSGLVIWGVWSFVCFVVAAFGMVKVLRPDIVLKKKWWFWASIVAAIIISISVVAVPRDDTSVYAEFKKAIKIFTTQSGPKGLDSKTIKNAKPVPANELDHIYSSPKKYKHRRVVVKGQVYDVRKTKKGIAFDLYSKLYSIEKISTIYYDKKDIDIKDEDYVVVDGIILGEDDVYDINLTYVNIKATKITKSNYIDVFTPTIKTYTVNKTIKQHGYKVTLKKVELAKNQTRAYIKVKNKGKGELYLYTPFAKIKQGNKKYFIDGDYILDYPKFLDTIKKGEKVKGIISFPAINLNKSFTLRIPSGSSKEKQHIKDYIFKVKAK